MKIVMCVLLCISFFSVSLLSTGCAGRDPNPVSMSVSGDDALSCDALLMQKQQAMDEMKKLKPKVNKFGTNTLWFIVFPFLMDVKDAEKIEYDAFKRRSDYLSTLMVSKGCVDVNDVVTSP